MRKKERPLIAKDLNKVSYAPNQAAARAGFHEFKARWGGLFPTAVKIIEKDLASLLTFFQFDATYWIILRTANLIERLNYLQITDPSENGLSLRSVNLR